MQQGVGTGAHMLLSKMTGTGFVFSLLLRGFSAEIRAHEVRDAQHNICYQSESTTRMKGGGRDSGNPDKVERGPLTWIFGTFLL